MRYSTRLLLAAATAGLAMPALAVDFLETFDNGVYANGAPVFDDGDLPEGNDWALAGDALVLSSNPTTSDPSGNRFAMWQVPGLST
ncbi:MAG: hypothetical protein AAF916_01200, partial [Planctomycetota bacterium]